MLPKKFLWRLILFFALAILTSSALFGGLLYRHLYESNLAILKDQLKHQTEVLSQLATGSPNFLRDPQMIEEVVHTEDRLTIIDPQGIVLADNWAERLGKEHIENHADRPEFQGALRGTPLFVRRFSRTVQREMIYYAVPLKQNQRIVAVLRLSFPMTTFYAQMKSVREFLITTACLALLFALTFAALVSRAITKHLHALRVSANRLASGDLSERVRKQGSMEFQELAESFNQMADQLRQKIVSVQKQHSQTEALLAKMVEGVLAMDRNGRAVFVNAAFCQMTGAKRERITGRSFLEIIRNDQLSDYISLLLSSNQAGLMPEAKEVRILAPDGEKDFAVQASRIHQNGDELSLLLLVFHDITQIKRLENMRKDFVANLGHELRTPLTALKGSTEILLDGAYTDPQQSHKFLLIMDKQLQNMQNLVNDMLKLAAAEDPRIPPRRELVEISSLISEILPLVQPLSTKKYQTLTTNLPDHFLEIWADPAQISDAILNVLDNAVKYSKEGSKIELRVQQEKDHLKIEIQDNGPGIQSDQLARIFERFYRVDKSRSKEMGGTGLGLSIAKHSVENHGGTITAYSEPGRYTIFTITLPLAREHVQPAVHLD